MTAFERETEPYGEPIGVRSHFCKEAGTTIYTDRATCPYCSMRSDA